MSEMKGYLLVFSKDIPLIVETWLEPNISGFLKNHGISLEEISHFIAHPGGKKVLEAYVKALNISDSLIEISLEILTEFGNMSSATILFVLKEIMELAKVGDVGLATALGPGFSSELLLMRWE